MILPQAAMGAVDPVAQALMPQEAFTWAHGGLKMTPEQAAAMRQQGMARARGDYSPIQHWTQGLARVADNVFGALEAKKAQKAMDATAEADRSLMEAISGGNVDDSIIARALMDPNVGQGVKQFAGMEYSARRPKQQAPLEIERLAMLANDPRAAPYVRDAAAAKLRNEVDPFVTFQGPSIGYTGRQSGLASAMGGGGPVSGVQPGGEPPAVLPSDFFDKEGGGGVAPNPFLGGL